MKKAASVFLIALISLCCSAPALPQVPAEPTEQAVETEQDRQPAAGSADQAPVVAGTSNNASLAGSAPTVPTEKPWVPEFGADTCASFDGSAANYMAGSKRIAREMPGTKQYLKWTRRVTEAGYCMVWGMLDKGNRQEALVHLERMEAWLKPYDKPIPVPPARLGLARIAWVKARLAWEDGRTEEDTRLVDRVLSLTADRDSHPEDYAGLSRARAVALEKWSDPSEIAQRMREACAIAAEMEALLKGTATRRMIECLAIEADAALKKSDEQHLLAVIQRARDIYAGDPSIRNALPVMHVRMREMYLATRLGQDARSARLRITMLEELASIFAGQSYVQFKTDEVSSAYFALICDCFQSIPEYADAKKRNGKLAEVYGRLSDALMTSLAVYPRNLSYASVVADASAKTANAFNQMEDWPAATVYAERAVQVADRAEFLAQFKRFSEQGIVICNAYSKAVETRVGSRSIAAATAAMNALDTQCGAWLQRFPWDFYARQPMVLAKWKYGALLVDAGEMDKAIPALHYASNWGIKDASSALSRIYGDATSPLADPQKADALKLLARRQGMKRFTVQTDFAGEKFPLYVYVSEYGAGPLCPSDRALTPQEADCIGFVGIDDQVTWAKVARGGILPADTVESFRKLFGIAQENNVSFPELCVCAMEDWKDSEPCAAPDKAKFIHTQMVKTGFRRNPDRWLDSAGLALSGYDPVSYTQRTEPVRGDASFFTLWDGALWLFSSAANRDLFLRDPERYAPQYGGFSATHIAEGRAFAGFPRIFSVTGNRLFLFLLRNNVADWNAKSKELITKTDARWLSVFPTRTALDSRLSKMILGMGDIATAPRHDGYVKDCAAKREHACKKLIAYADNLCTVGKTTSGCSAAILLAETAPHFSSWLVSLLGNRSWYYTLDNKPDAAIADATRALAIDPDQPWIRLNLANGLLVKGKTGQAMAIYKAQQDRPGHNKKGTICPLLLEDIAAMLAKKLIAQKVADRVRKAIVCKQAPSTSATDSSASP